MLRLTSRIDYGIRALARLAESSPRGVMTAIQLSEVEQIPVQFLEQILVSLRRAGLIRSIRGPGGGYTLARPANQITLKEVFEVLEGPTVLVKCLDPSNEEGCDWQKKCVARLLFERLQQSLLQILEETTLADLVRMGREAGVLEPEPEPTG